jgi:hypothetical protein
LLVDPVGGDGRGKKERAPTRQREREQKGGTKRMGGRQAGGEEGRKGGGSRGREGGREKGRETCTEVRQADHIALTYSH